MRRLDVLYDARCGLCRLARLWASEQPAFLELVFLPAGSDEAKLRFPELATSDAPEELIVVSDEGHVYRESSAWIMVLYALEEYREWSLRLASPALRPFARQAFSAVSKHRKALSAWLGLSDDDTLKALSRVDAPACSVVMDLRVPNLQNY